MATATPSPAPQVKVNLGKASPQERVFYGELPPSVSFLTEKGKAVFFYQGYHVTTDSEVVEFCQALAGVEEVTGKVKLEEVPMPSARSRARNWAAASKMEISPAELLQRAAIASSATMGGNTAESNSGSTPPAA